MWGLGRDPSTREKGRSRERATQGGIVGRKLERGNGITKREHKNKGACWG